MPITKTSRNSAFIFDWRIAEIAQAIRGDNTCAAATDKAASALAPAANSKHQSHHDISGALFMQVLYQSIGKTGRIFRQPHNRAGEHLRFSTMRFESGNNQNNL